MKAIVYKQYGSPDVLQLGACNKPVPRDNELLIKVSATTVTAADCRIRSLTMPFGFGLLSRLVFGVKTPRNPILGTEFSGVVEAVGRRVSRFNIGDSVFGITGMKMGCYAEYLCISEAAAVAKKPESISLNEAAALSFGGTTALHFLRLAKLQAGEKIFINGASGSVGVAVLQMAKYFQAEITASCSSHNIELVKSLGADEVIDYTCVDIVDNHQRYDVIVDTVGNLSFASCQPLLKKGGRLVLIAASLPQIIAALWQGRTSDKKVLVGTALERQEDVALLAKLVEDKQFIPVIDSYYPLADIVAAHRYVDTGRKRGNLVITLT